MRLFKRAFSNLFFQNKNLTVPGDTEASINSNGYAFIPVINRNKNDLAVFILYDIKKDKILHSEICKAKNMFTLFKKFVINIFRSNSIKNKSTIFLPKMLTSKGLLKATYDFNNEDKERVILYTSRDLTSNSSDTMEEAIFNFKLFFKNQKLTSLNKKEITKILNSYNEEKNDTINPSQQNLSVRQANINNLRSSRLVQPTRIQNRRSYSTMPNHKWTSFYFNSFKLLDAIAIKKCLNLFWENVIKVSLKNNPKLKISIQFRVRLNDDNIRSLSTLDVVTLKDLKKLITAYIVCWEAKRENYNSLNVSEIIIFYKIQPANFKAKFNTGKVKHVKSFSKSTINEKIPSNMDIKTWGPYKFNEALNKYNIQIKNSDMYAEVLTQLEQNSVYIFIKQISGLLKIRQFIDKPIGNDSKDLTTFKRTFDKITIYFNKGVQVLFLELIKVNFIRPLKSKNCPNYKIITMDLETREIIEDDKKKLEPICVSLYIGGVKDPIIKSFKIWDYTTSDDMIRAAFNSILIKKYSGYSIYFHNFAYFDGIFVTKILVNMTDIKVNITSREGKLLKLEIKYGKHLENCVTIFDSFLILPSSLDKLSKTFGSPAESKGFFPLKIVNDSSISLDYDGHFPELKHFYHPNPLNRIAYNKYVKEYEEFKSAYLKSNKKWNLKKELVKYCEQDCISLHNVIKIFTKEIHDKFKINISKYPTLPSIAFAIFRKSFMKALNIPILGGGVYNDIKKAYYGGFVDVYKPYAKNVKSYDVNSLYPSSMKNCQMPVGTPIYFEGDHSLHFNNLFGFVYTKVNAPLNLKTPILPLKTKVKGGGLSTIYPTGNWRGWYFTEELNNAKKYGYTFEIIKGYHFEKTIVFSSYVQALYDIKCSVSSDNPWYQISKLLLNSLYGRFGMSPDLEVNKIINVDELDNWVQNPEVIITDAKELGDKFWMSYEDLSKSKSDEEKLPDVSVSVAAAITAWSRIHMTEFIMKYSDHICAIDTDGVKLTCELMSILVGKELGKMKDEGTFKEAVFIAPKVYGGITQNNEVVVKVKGLKSPIPYSELKSLLLLENIKIHQNKWYRNFSESTINIYEQIYTLCVTENKREIIRDSSGKFIDTKPYQVSDGEIIIFQ